VATSNPRPSRRPTRYGWAGPGGGKVSWVEAPTEYRGTSVQVCGLWPYGTGSATPTIGAPLGRHRYTSATVCFDPISWYERAKLINNPSVWIQSEPGMGKALDVDTLIPTPSGNVRMGDLRPGDAVFDEHGQPTTVVAASETWTGRECLKVVFSDGTEIIADTEHLWVTETQRQRQRRFTQRLRPPARAVLGTAAEQKAVAKALAATTAGQRTTLTQLAIQLGWRDDSRRHRLYAWSQQLPVLSGNVRDRTYDKTMLLQQIAMALATPRQGVTRDDDRPVTTREIAGSLLFNNKSNHAIVVTGIDGADADLPLDPRLLGLWLGDGTSQGGGFTTADPELVDEFAAAGFAVRQVSRYGYSISAARPAPEPRCTNCQFCGTPIAAPRRRQRMCSNTCASRSRGNARFRVPLRSCVTCARPLSRGSIADRCPPCAQRATFVGRLREAGVLAKKHIPAVYLRASVAQRRALLSGLLDTDGTVSSTGQVQFTTTNPRLAGDVHELIASLRYRPSTAARTAKLNGRPIGPMWQVGFSTADEVFGLDRKRRTHEQRRQKTSAARNRARYIVAVEPVESRPVRCIQVANPSGLYLATRSFVTTHNSTSVRRMLLSLVAQGVTPLILGDLKPDYAELVAALGGRVLKVGPGLHRLNPLDVGPWRQVLDRVSDPQAAEQLRAEVVDRRLNAAAVLLTLMRGGPLESGELTVVAAALRWLADREENTQPVLSDVLKVIEDAPGEVRWVTLWHTEEDLPRYREETENLRRALRALIHGPLGPTVEGHTTAPIDLDTIALCVDISGISETNHLLTAAALVTTWAAGFGQVEAAHRLADLGLAPPRTFFLVLDEMWRALRVGHGMVDRIDALTRLNRAKGTGTAFLTHSLADLEALPDPEDRAKARGFADRCAVMMIGACSEQELDAVSRVRPLSQAERAEVLSWSAPPAWSAGIDGEEVMIGRGNFLIKVGNRPGIPVHLEPTEIEKRLGNTDARWNRQ
jgi:hypothetical protein